MSKVKLSTVKEINDALVYFSKVKSNKKFLFIVLKNLNLVKDHISVLENLIKPNDNYIEYQKKLFGLIKKYGVTDEKGKLKSENSNTGEISYPIQPDKLGEFNLKMEELKESNSELFKELDKINLEIEEILNSEIDHIAFIKIPIDLFPDEIDKPEIFQVLYNNNLIEE